MESRGLTRWLTLGANAGVLIGLVLLILELDQNRELMRAQTRHELSMGIADLLQTPAENDQLADLLFRAQTGAGLTPTELYRFQLRTNALFRYWEDVHYQYRVGLYDEVEFDRQRAAWKASMSRSDFGTDYWCLVRLLYSPEFAAEMDRLVDNACGRRPNPMIPDQIQSLADRYTAAWNSNEPDRVASFFSENGTLYVNGTPNQGREAISNLARSFMEGFPDLALSQDSLEIRPGLVTYHWTFTGTNTGPGGTGNPVRFSGFEEWTLGADQLISQSMGHFDEAEYQSQLESGLGGSRP